MDAAPESSKAGDPDGVLSSFPYSPNGLMEAARRFARSAVSNYSLADAPFFFLHAGASAELLLKAGLCAASPALLLDRQFKEDALFRLMGLRPASSAEGNRADVNRPPYTVGFAKAVDRYLMLHGTGSLGVRPESLDLLKAGRDLAAHGSGSSVVTSEMHTVLLTLVRVVSAVLPRLGATEEEFWGEHAVVATRALEEERDQATTLTRTLVSAARQRFNSRYEGVPPESLARLKEETFWELNPKPHEWSRVCPACGSQGISALRPELRRQVLEAGGLRAVAGYKAIDFRCPICQLTLETEELVDAAEDFEPWEEEIDDLPFWADDFGWEHLGAHEITELGFDPEKGPG